MSSEACSESLVRSAGSFHQTLIHLGVCTSFLFHHSLLVTFGPVPYHGRAGLGVTWCWAVPV